MKGNQIRLHERSLSVEPENHVQQQVRREVENFILQFEQIADWVKEIEYDEKIVNVREFFQRVISRYQLEREESLRQKLNQKHVLPEIDLSGTKIITVEDNEDISTLLALILQSTGTEVTRVSSAFRALDLLESMSFNAVVSDIGMPEMSGLEFMRTLRARGDQTPAVALSSYTTDEDKQAAVDAGFNLFLAKPVHPANFVMGIARLVTNGN